MTSLRLFVVCLQHRRPLEPLQESIEAIRFSNARRIHGDDHGRGTEGARPDEPAAVPITPVTIIRSANRTRLSPRPSATRELMSGTWAILTRLAKDPCLC